MLDGQPVIYSTATVSETEFMDFLHTVGPQIGKLSHDKLFEESGDIYHIYRNGGRSNLFIRFQHIAKELAEQQGYLAEMVAEKDEYVATAFEYRTGWVKWDTAVIEKRIAQATQFLQAEPKTTVLLAFEGEKEQEKHEAQQMMLEFIVRFAKRVPQCLLDDGKESYPEYPDEATARFLQGVGKDTRTHKGKLWSMEEVVHLYETEADMYEVLEEVYTKYHPPKIRTAEIKLTSSAAILDADWFTFLDDELEEYMGIGGHEEPIIIYLKGAYEANEFAQYIEVTKIEVTELENLYGKTSACPIETIEGQFGHTPRTLFTIRLTYLRDEAPDTRLIVQFACALAQRYPNIVALDPDPERIIRIPGGQLGIYPMVRGADIVPWRLYSTEELLTLNKEGKGLDTYWSPTATKSIAG
jgi:hypothetical protein